MRKDKVVSCSCNSSFPLFLEEEGVIYDRGKLYVKMMRIKCANCGAHGIWQTHVEDAVDKWNLLMAEQPDSMIQKIRNILYSFFIFMIIIITIIIFIDVDSLLLRIYTTYINHGTFEYAHTSYNDGDEE